MYYKAWCPKFRVIKELEKTVICPTYEFLILNGRVVAREVEDDES